MWDALRKVLFISFYILKKYSFKLFLKKVNLKHKFNSLDDLIEETGDHLSAGEKQLLCFARALLKKSKILLCDEITSNVDEKYIFKL